MTSHEGFAAEAAADARLLILGSLPGMRSLAERRYYAHPRNAFWSIASELFDISPDLPYDDRVAALVARRVALWDVLRASRRPGSLDAAIDTSSAVPNDFPSFLAAHPELRMIAFNGRKAAELFERLVVPALPCSPPERVVLPSTSPANAAMSVAEKVRRWSLVTTALRD